LHCALGLLELAFGLGLCIAGRAAEAAAAASSMSRGPPAA
jgi:hypothetical protein